MSLTSFQFIGIFFIYMIIYFFSNKNMRKGLLIIANILFCLSFSNNGIFYLGGLILYTYWMGKHIYKNKNKKSFITAILIVVLGLFLAKYLIFAFNLLRVEVTFNLIVPIGISFYTFKIISFLVDLYQGKIQEFPKLMDYIIYVSFFPQLASGPIQRPNPFFADLDNISHELSYDELKTGFITFMFGIFEKMVIANRLAFLVNQIYGNVASFSSLEIIIAMVAYSFQLYCDFDAYSNMAIGLGRMMGFSTMRNFHTPYLAKNMQDFWRRWHISMSSWFRDYVYIPLGGNRTHHKYRNVFIVSIVSGLWHGASFNFVIWGLMHGFAQYVSGEFHELVTTKIKVKSKFVSFIGTMISTLLTFTTVTILWLFFRLSSAAEINEVFRGLLQFNFSINYDLLGITRGQFIVTVLFVILVIAVDLFRNYANGIASFKKWPLACRWFVYLSLVILFILFAMYGGGYHPEDFIYIQF